MRTLFWNHALGLYHLKVILPVLTILLLTSCTPPQITQSLIDVSIISDEKPIAVQLPAGSTVQEALDLAHIELGNLDRTEPSPYTVLSDSSEVHIIRVREEFFIEQVIIPFENQKVRNELIPIGETRLSQPGVNGLQEITYRMVYENDEEVSKSVVKTVTVREPVPEIVMVGSRTPFATIPVKGRLAYLSNGNAWIIEGTTANRRPVVTTGDLDGQVFSLSSDGSWLTFTRKSEDENAINSLWAVEIDNDTETLIDLDALNVIHFAEWNPELSVLAYSTVEPRSAPPGWQANNDLITVGVSSSGYVSPAREEMEPNSGGVYGWWGTTYAWSPDGQVLAYGRPDGIGLFDPRDDEVTPIIDIIPYQTGSDWAWIPGFSWSPGQEMLYTVAHIPPASGISPEESQNFDLVAIPLAGGPPIHLANDVGMFSYPVPSPLRTQSGSSETDDENINLESYYQIAFLEAIFPNQSEASRYKLNVMDRDGSNRRILFPTEGSQGLEPQKVSWSPADANSEGNPMIALLYQNNIWLVDTVTGLTYQITGDGLTVKIDWK